MIVKFCDCEILIEIYKTFMYNNVLQCLLIMLKRMNV